MSVCVVGVSLHNHLVSVAVRALFLHSAFRARFHVAEETMILQGLSIESQYSRDVYHQTPNGGIIQDQAVQLDTAVC
jgi:hypothetical protein